MSVDAPLTEAPPAPWPTHRGDRRGDRARDAPRPARLLHRPGRRRPSAARCRAPEGLWEEFGPDALREAPISESAMVGAALGAALFGPRPIVEVSFGEFLPAAMNQLINQAPNLHYMTGGAARAPVVSARASGTGRTADTRRTTRSGLPTCRVEGGHTGHASRREGADARRHPRRQPGARRRADVARARPARGCRPGLPGAYRSRRGLAREGTDLTLRDHRLDGTGRDAGGGSARRRGH